MKYIELRDKFVDFIVFSVGDLRKIEPDFDVRRLNEWQEKGYIKKVRQGYYIFSDLELNESVLFVIANKIYNPSYVSFEMTLSYYGLIPESVYGVTCATTNKTYSFDSVLGKFIYHKIKPELMFGYKLINYKNHNFKIAEIEKAILDYFYINTSIKNNDDFEGLRFNIEEFKEKVDYLKLEKYLKAFGNKSLSTRINKFLKFIKNADTATN